MNEISYNLFYIFYVVAKTGNITKASEQLFISQPAVSYSIKKLEKILGGTLFSRSKKGVILTLDGERIYEQIAQAIETLNVAGKYFDDMKNLKMGKLRIGSDTSNITACLTDYLKAYNTIHPNIDIQIIHDNGEKLLEKLLNNKLDILIMNLPFKNEQVEIIKEFKLNNVIYCGKDLYPKYKNMCITLENIENLPFVLLDKNYTSRKSIDLFFENNNVVIKPKYEFDSYSLVGDFVEKGFGLGISIDKYIENQLSLGEAFILKTDFEIRKRKIGIVVRKDKSFSLACSKFIDILQNKNR